MSWNIFPLWLGHLCVPGRDSVRGGPRQPARTCRSVRTTCEPWTCLMNCSLLSLTTWLKDNTWVSSTPQLSTSSSSSSFCDGSKMETHPANKVWGFGFCYLFYTTLTTFVLLPVVLDICLTALSTTWPPHGSQETT